VENHSPAILLEQGNGASNSDNDSSFMDVRPINATASLVNHRLLTTMPDTPAMETMGAIDAMSRTHEAKMDGIHINLNLNVSCPATQNPPPCDCSRNVSEPSPGIRNVSNCVIDDTNDAQDYKDADTEVMYYIDSICHLLDYHMATDDNRVATCEAILDVKSNETTLANVRLQRCTGFMLDLHNKKLVNQTCRFFRAHTHFLRDLNLFNLLDGTTKKNRAETLKPFPPSTPKPLRSSKSVASPARLRIRSRKPSSYYSRFFVG
jgi:hypothetical protein